MTEQEQATPTSVESEVVPVPASDEVAIAVSLNDDLDFNDKNHPQHAEFALISEEVNKFYDDSGVNLDASTVSTSINSTDTANTNQTQSTINTSTSSDTVAVEMTPSKMSVADSSVISVTDTNPSEFSTSTMTTPANESELSETPASAVNETVIGNPSSTANNSQTQSQIQDTTLQKILQHNSTQSKEAKMNQLFLYVRNSGFDKLRQMVSANQIAVQQSNLTGNNNQPFPLLEDIATARDQQGHTFLHWGALGGDLEFCKWAVEVAKVPADAVTFNGQSSLMWASLRGHHRIVRYLLDQQVSPVDIRRKDSLGATPLLLAIQHRRKMSFFLLIKRDPKTLDDVDSNGCGCVHWAAYKADMFFLRYLDYFLDFKGSYFGPNLNDIAGGGSQSDSTTVQTMSDSAYDYARMTPLHRAVIGGSYEVCEFLIKKSCDPYHKDQDGQDALSLAEKDTANPYLALALERGIEKHRNRERYSKKPNGVPDAETVGAGSGSGGSDSNSSCKKGCCEHDSSKKGSGESSSSLSTITNDIKSFFKDQEIIKYTAPAIYLIAACLALYIHIEYLHFLGQQIFPFHTYLVSLLVPTAILWFLRMTQSNPGIVEKRPIGRSAVEDVMAEIDSDDPPPSAKKLMRICTECWIQKDLRTKHDSVTNVCVLEFDHFCGWLGLPIGRENHRGFIMLAIIEIVAQFAHFTLLMRVSIIEAAREHTGTSEVPFGAAASHSSDPSDSVSPSLIDTSNHDHPNTNDVGILATIYFMLTSYSLLFLCLLSHIITIPWIICIISYHLRLVLKNLTTNEIMNMSRYDHFWVVSEEGGNGQQRKVFHNPWDKGSNFANWMDFWWHRQRSIMGNTYKSIPLMDVGEEENL